MWLLCYKLIRAAKVRIKSVKNQVGSSACAPAEARICERAFLLPEHSFIEFCRLTFGNR
jgi:hypothetical protein